MSETPDEIYFSVCYDIERPWNKKWEEIRKKPENELTTYELQEIQKRKEWDKLIGRFIDELNNIGFRINWSVYLIPQKYYDRAKNIVERYTKRFNQLGARNDIYILKYHPDSNDILISKVIMHMKFKIEKLIKNYIKAKENNDKYEERVVIREIELILSLATSFGIKDRIESYLSSISDKYNVDIRLFSHQESLENLASIYE